MNFGQAQKRIDDEILEHKRRILELKTRRSTHTHISRVPNEVLADIFAIAKRNSSNIRQWHQFAHVCRHWRCVALEATSLWTSPPSDLHDYTIVMLDRSRECPLNIRLDYRTSASTIAAVVSHVGRMRSLSIVQSNEALNNFQDALLSSGINTPQLKDLSISHPTYLEDQPTPVFKLLASTFTPRTTLDRLSLNGIDLEWQIFPIPNLTSLSLVFLELSNPPSWTQFLEALRGMPRLESMSSSFETLKLTSQPASHLGPLQMPYLQHIDIHWSTASDIHTFLCYTTHPRLRAAFFECSSSYGADPHDYTAASRSVISLAAHGNFGPLNQLVVGNDRFRMVNQGRKALERRELEFWCPPTPTVPQNPRLAHDAMSAIASLPDNATSAILHLSLLEDYTFEQLVDLFGRLSCIESIRARTSSWAVIQSITVTATSRKDEPGCLTRFAHLKKLGLKQDDYTPELFENLCSCLDTRQKHGYGIK